MADKRADLTALGWTLHNYRQNNGLTQQEMADRIGVSVNTIHLWETRHCRPAVSSMRALAQLLHEPLPVIVRMSRMTLQEMTMEEHNMGRKPELVVMAAGMGSRYGGIKQIDPLNKQGDTIIDFSVYDAMKAGFEKVWFIIRKEMEPAFSEVIGEKLSAHIQIGYIYQEADALPEGFVVPADRTKPWGTGHAILSCYGKIHGPFVVINADDYYGPHAFRTLYDYLCAHPDKEIYQYAMSGYQVENTLTENGYVSRGICEIDETMFLTGIQERTHIECRDGRAFYTEDGAVTWHDIKQGSIVSMNMWGFHESILEELKDRFPVFLRNGLTRDPLGCEFFLPDVVSALLAEKKACVRVLPCSDRWYGVTYRKDKEMVSHAIQEMKKQGLYPEILWSR